MGQKYKVFSEKSLIHIIESSKKNFLHLKADKITNFQSFEELTYNAEIIIESNDPLDDLSRIFNDFEVIVAAGGIVTSDDSILFIHRLGFWDLPKGKVEEGEPIMDAAFREVKEECGIHEGLKVVDEFKTTYHVYEYQGKSIFKKTHWYHMHLSKCVNLSPQYEEDILECRWISFSDIGPYLEKSYPLINDLIIDFCQDK